MKAILLFLVASAAAAAAGERVFTVTAISTNGVPVTNAIAVLNGQAVRVSAIVPVFGIGEPGAQASIVKGGREWPIVRGDCFQGPAVFKVWAFPAGEGGQDRPALLSFERWAVPRSAL